MKMSGSRFYVLRGAHGPAPARAHRVHAERTRRRRLHRALPARTCSPRQSLFASGQLPKFRDNLYHDAEEDYCFIPTAEVAFVNLYRDEILPPGQLPLRFVGAHALLPARKDERRAGRARHQARPPVRKGRDVRLLRAGAERGRTRVPRSQRARTIPEILGLPYRVLELCTGDLGFNATRTFDLEIWAPGQGEWLEVSSASNCLDFQARRANIRYRRAADASPRHPHMLNASGLALPRTVIAVMENYQHEDGSIAIPEALQPYMGGQTVIPAHQKISG